MKLAQHLKLTHKWGQRFKLSNSIKFPKIYRSKINLIQKTTQPAEMSKSLFWKWEISSQKNQKHIRDVTGESRRNNLELLLPCHHPRRLHRLRPRHPRPSRPPQLAYLPKNDEEKRRSWVIAQNPIGTRKMLNQTYSCNCGFDFCHFLGLLLGGDGLGLVLGGRRHLQGMNGARSERRWVECPRDKREKIGWWWSMVWPIPSFVRVIDKGFSVRSGLIWAQSHRPSSVWAG